MGTFRSVGRSPMRASKRLPAAGVDIGRASEASMLAVMVLIFQSLGVESWARVVMLEESDVVGSDVGKQSKLTLGAKRQKRKLFGEVCWRGSSSIFCSGGLAFTARDLPFT